MYGLFGAPRGQWMLEKGEYYMYIVYIYISRFTDHSQPLDNVTMMVQATFFFFAIPVRRISSADFGK